MSGLDKKNILPAIKAAVLGNRWGGQSLISLYISLVSGIILALQYDAGEAFYSTATIELIVPYGSFWRGLHYYSSQFFFLLLLGHVLTILWKQEDLIPRKSWIRLCSSLPAALLLLFTGYVLRGDATGEAAGAIAENLCLSIPLIGEWINDLFFDIQDSGLRKVYMHHLIGLVAMGAYALWPHLKRYPALWRNHVFLILGTIMIAVFLATPSEPDKIGLLHIAGPWFFLGLQELLRYMPAFVAGVLLPLLPMVLLYLLPGDVCKRKGYIWGIGLWLLVYGIISIVSYVRIATS
ncbi:cytochrome b N-terminal domain-containing protein [Desulfogranum marinum]|jgi:ubiquinol-cytochrome c reductase cytochrome b subunit|uniref:cytochrome b N-terminal domain-containing protein n=1 Tax=Desulfogranum marinum TaxID=453220 RepID=UPI0019656376|nr:cytochrome b N-terminal domain-containing protein [Desulfogranum marinum]MBM9510880.1 cytochrome b N-terminal domain-containing protein [Desulfogranum marinum]